MRSVTQGSHITAIGMFLKTMMQTHSQQVGTCSRQVMESGKTPDIISAGLFSHTDLRALACVGARARVSDRTCSWEHLHQHQFVTGDAPQPSHSTVHSSSDSSEPD